MLYPTAVSRPCLEDSIWLVCHSRSPYLNVKNLCRRSVESFCNPQLKNSIHPTARARKAVEFSWTSWVKSWSISLPDRGFTSKGPARPATQHASTIAFCINNGIIGTGGKRLCPDQKETLTYWKIGASGLWPC